MPEPADSRSVPLADLEGRSAVREHLDETLFVEAGAGSGKTTALVGRIVELVRARRVGLGEIAAITFTEAAAAELRARLHRALVSAEDPWLNEQAHEIEDATITTIHGFAQRLLSEHPIEAGLPLRFEVLDEIAGAIDFERRFAAFLDRLYEDGRVRSVLLGALALGVRPTALAAVSRAIEERFDPSVLPGSPAPDETLEELVSRAAREVESAAVDAVARRADCRVGGDRLFDLLGELDVEVTAAHSGRDWLDELRWLVSLVGRKAGRTGNREDWDDIEAVRDAISEYDEVRRDALESVGSHVAARLGRLLLEEARLAADVRRRTGRLRFHDLLIGARDLVRDHPGIHRAVRARFRYVLVDEFQDTDPVQLELLMLIGSQSGVLEPGRLFFVGDPKQSIYAFRGAALALYEQARREISGDEPARLVTNFRSVPGVVAFVNEVFAELFATTSPTLSLSRAADLVAVRDAGERPAVVCFGAPGELRAAERRATESAEVAALLLRAIEEGWTVEDRGERRRLRAGDVAILLPTRTSLPALEDALDEVGLDYRVAHSTLVYASLEVRELLMLLAAVDDPGDERVVLGALRTSALGCSDADLLAWRQAGGSWRLDGDAVIAGSVQEACSRLWEISRMRHELQLDALLERLVERCSLRQLLAWRRNRAEGLRRLEFVLDRARGFVRAGGSSIGEFLDLADREARSGARGVELLASDDETDAVRILTIHGAKGLEFPFVVLADLGADRGSAAPEAGALGGATGIEWRLGSGCETAGYAAALATERQLEREESIRLAYVAATRARDYLAIGLSHRPSRSGTGSLAQAITAAIEAGGSQPARFAPLVAPRTPARRSAGERAGHRPLAGSDLTARRDRRTRLLERAARPRSIASSSLSERDGFDPAGGRSRRRERLVASDRAAEDDQAAGWFRARQASALGRAVHLVLQRADLSGEPDLDALVRRAAEEEDVLHRTDAVKALALAALSCDAVTRASTRPWHRREVPFSLALDHGVLEGVVDLCYPEDDGLVVVDYKTDQLSSPGEADRTLPRYRLQAGAYALGLSLVTGIEVRRVVFVFLSSPNGAVVRELPDLASAREDARTTATARLSAGVLG